MGNGTKGRVVKIILSDLHLKKIIDIMIIIPYFTCQLNLKLKIIRSTRCLQVYIPL